MVGHSEAEYCCEPDDVCLGDAHHPPRTDGGAARTPETGAAVSATENADEPVDADADLDEDGALPRLQLIAWESAHRHGPVRPRQRRRRRERPPHRWC